MPFADMTEDTAVQSKESYGTEVDLNLNYKLADNVAYNLNFGYFSGGDAIAPLTNSKGGVPGAGATDTAMVLWNRITFKF